MNHFPVDLVVSIVVAVLASTGLWNWLFYRTKRKDEMMDNSSKDWFSRSANAPTTDSNNHITS